MSAEIRMCVKIFVSAISCYVIYNNGVKGVSVIERVPPYKCDRSSFLSHISREGVIGQTALFPWYGLLKVYLHDMGSVTVAVTGLVLVRDHYAIANADDVVKIPENIFIKSSEAMFILRNDKVEYYSLLGYVTHPEYPSVTSIALVDLHPGDSIPFPILPVCQPRIQFNTANELYVLGFTDDNGPLEKFLYKMLFVDPKTCKHFYKLAKLTEATLVPDKLKCAATKNIQEACVWETGAALVSNVTGTWALVGFGVRGPGCAAPARFISLTTYWPWILSQTSLTSVQENYVFKQGFKDYRRRHGGTTYYNDLTKSRIDHFRPSSLMHTKPVPEFKPPSPEMQYVPLHEILRATPDNTLDPPANTLDPPAKVYDEHLHHHNKLMVDDMFQIDRTKATEIHISKGRGRWGDCWQPNMKLIYKDSINVTMERSNRVRTSGSIQYKVSLYDLWFSNYTCVTIKAVTAEVQEAYLQYTVGMSDGGDIFPWNQEEILKYYNLVDPLNKTKDPHANMNKYVITQPVLDLSIPSLMLYLRVLFANTSRLEMKVFGLVTPPDLSGNSSTFTIDG